jgi:hypothetical protein
MFALSFLFLNTEIHTATAQVSSFSQLRAAKICAEVVKGKSVENISTCMIAHLNEGLEKEDKKVMQPRYLDKSCGSVGDGIRRLRGGKNAAPSCGWKQHFAHRGIPSSVLEPMFVFIQWRSTGVKVATDAGSVRNFIHQYLRISPALSDTLRAYENAYKPELSRWFQRLSRHDIDQGFFKKALGVCSSQIKGQKDLQKSFCIGSCKYKLSSRDVVSKKGMSFAACEQVNGSWTVTTFTN